MNDTGEVRGGPAYLPATWSHILSKKNQNTSIPPDPSPVDSTIHCLLEVKNNPLMFIVKKLISLGRTWLFNDRSMRKWVFLEVGTEMPIWGSVHAYHVLSLTSVVQVVGVTEVARFIPSLTNNSSEKVSLYPVQKDFPTDLIFRWSGVDRWSLSFLSDVCQALRVNCEPRLRSLCSQMRLLPVGTWTKA